MTKDGNWPKIYLLIGWACTSLSHSTENVQSGRRVFTIHSELVVTGAELADGLNNQLLILLLVERAMTVITTITH